MIPFAFTPSLGQENPGFNRLTEANFVGEDCALGQRGAEGKKGRLDLVWIRVNLGVSQRCSEKCQTVVKIKSRCNEDVWNTTQERDEVKTQSVSYRRAIKGIR